MAAFFAGKFREDKHYDAEIIMAQVFLVTYTICLYIIAVVVWRFGVRIQKLVRQRATIADQFKSRERINMTDSIVQRLPYDTNRQPSKSEASLHSSAERVSNLARANNLQATNHLLLTLTKSLDALC